MIDSAILEWINGFAGTWPALDEFVWLVADNALFKGAPFMALCWWLWFRPGADEAAKRRREVILATLLSTLLALILARMLALLLPFRPRPLHDPASGVRLVAAVRSDVLDRWSSLPSDHATLFFALSTGFALAAPRLAVWLFAYTLLVICLPRVYLGLHYPSDLAVGAALGVAVVLLANIAAVRGVLARPLLACARRWPGPFYAGFFLLTFQLATLFDATRQLLGYLRQALG
jgi:undecaprenyl-diphosphatase